MNVAIEQRRPMYGARLMLATNPRTAMRFSIVAASMCVVLPAVARADEAPSSTASATTTGAPANDPQTLPPVAVDAPAAAAPAPPVYPVPNGYGYTPLSPEADDARHPGPGRVPVEFVSRSETVAIGVPLFESVNFSANGYAGTDIYGRRICSTPCTAYLPVGRFRFTINDSVSGGTYGEIFVASVGSHVELRATSTSRRAIGFATTVIGGVTTVAGIFFVTTTALATPLVRPVETGWAVGGTLLGAGLVGLATGIVLLATSRPTVLSNRALDRVPALSFGYGNAAASVALTLRF